MENDNKIPLVLERSSCHRHNADRNQPCWEIHRLADPKLRLPAVCNNRAQFAGMDAPIDPRSLRKS